MFQTNFFPLYLLQINDKIALDSHKIRLSSFRVGTQWAGFITKNSGLFWSPLKMSKLVIFGVKSRRLISTSQARALKIDSKDGLIETYCENYTNQVAKLHEWKVRTTFLNEGWIEKISYMIMNWMKMIKRMIIWRWY